MLSNLSECRITKKGIVYRSAEPRIVYKLAQLFEDNVVATKVFFEEIPYNIINMSKSIKKTDKWSLEKEKEIVQGKCAVEIRSKSGIDGETNQIQGHPIL